MSSLIQGSLKVGQFSIDFKMKTKNWWFSEKFQSSAKNAFHKNLKLDANKIKKRFHNSLLFKEALTWFHEFFSIYHFRAYDKSCNSQIKCALIVYTWLTFVTPNDLEE